MEKWWYGSLENPDSHPQFLDAVALQYAMCIFLRIKAHRKACVTLFRVVQYFTFRKYIHCFLPMLAALHIQDTFSNSVFIEI